MCTTSATMSLPWLLPFAPHTLRGEITMSRGTTAIPSVVLTTQHAGHAGILRETLDGRTST
ncbi:hypothetical protein GCM10027444_17430 [Actinopolyspora lacussalsi]